MQFLIPVLALVLFGLAWAGTVVMQRLAPTLGLVQAPNARSSHTVPTARGGGAAIALVVVGGTVALGLGGATNLLPIAGLTGLIALLGFADDLRDLSPALRFPVQALVMGALVWTVGPLPQIALPFDAALGGLGLQIIVVLVGLWWVNLFNFMDGIDGIAGSQAVLLLVAGAALVGFGGEASALAAAGAAATAGFLMRNWPPARIFMGDAGSNALALVIFAVALLTLEQGQMNYPAWLILPAAFVADATVTLVRRIRRGERPWHAHRRHGYQQLSRQWGHRRVTVLYGLLTLLWATPLAWLAQDWAWGWGVAMVAYLPLVVFVIWAGGGSVEERGMVRQR
jgi:Fuc2NAc and GlcNAc transferase